MWQIHQPARTIFGEGEIKNLGKYMEEEGLKQALLIATPSMVRHGIADKVKEYSNGRIVAISSEVEPDPTIQNVNANLAVAKEIKAECIVAIGGGSAIDCAKVTAAAYAEGVQAEAFLGMQFKPEKVLPLVIIPTTSGSGSELTGDAGIHDKENGGLGGVVMNYRVMPRIALVDPELTYTVPASVTAHTGFDALAHAIDALGSIYATPYSDAMAEAAIRIVFENLEKAVANGNDKEARKNMATASHMAGYAFSQSGITGSHASGFAVSGRYHIPHGAACAFAVEYWFAANAKVRPELEASAKRIGFDSVDALCKAIARMRKNVGITDTLTGLGYQEGDEKLLADLTLKMFPMDMNLAKPSETELEEMYKSRI